MKIKTTKYIIFALLFISFFNKIDAKEGEIIGLQIQEIKGLKKGTIINCIAIEDSNKVWLGTQKGLVKIVNEKVDTTYYDKKEKTKWGINVMVVDQSGTKWLGSNDGSLIALKKKLVKNKPNTNQNIKNSPSNISSSTPDNTTYNNEYFEYSTDDDLPPLRKNLIKQYHTNHNASRNIPNDLIDTNKKNDEKFENEKKPTVIFKDSVQTFHPSKGDFGMMHSMATVNNQLIMGTAKGYIMTTNINSVELTYPKKLLSENNITSVTLDKDGNPYLATDNTKLVDINSVEKYKKLSYLKRIYKIKPSKLNPNSFWVIGKQDTPSDYKKGQGIYPYSLANINKDSNDSLYTNSNCLLDDYKGGRFTDFDTDTNNIVWVGTNKELLMYDPENQYYSTIKEKKIKSIRYLTIKHTGTIWIVSNDNKVFKINYIFDEKNIPNEKSWNKYNLIKETEELSKAIHFTDNSNCKMKEEEKKNKGKRRKRKKKEKGYEAILRQLSQKFLSKRCQDCYEMTIYTSVPDSTQNKRFKKIGGPEGYAEKKADRVSKRLKKKYNIDEDKIQKELVPTTDKMYPYWVRLEVACIKKKPGIEKSK